MMPFLGPYVFDVDAVDSNPCAWHGRGGLTDGDNPIRTPDLSTITENRTDLGVERLKPNGRSPHPVLIQPITKTEHSPSPCFQKFVDTTRKRGRRAPIETQMPFLGPYVFDVDAVDSNPCAWHGRGGLTDGDNPIRTPDLSTITENRTDLGVERLKPNGRSPHPVLIQPITKTEHSPSPCFQKFVDTTRKRGRRAPIETQMPFLGPYVFDVDAVDSNPCAWHGRGGLTVG
ncbi:hypothetical protein VOLCADRAFT_93830 [Volvox carteri f. nagariensis]|uniref:Uncharacterized protein n=1 Tax=Volvox carteri f. nagariensis TaxID=3068 RepID=D8U363_VOLCA|nr:uncharacterized protein VOLCADRAFT_93830 [Volvox carteri f. nagariensis]EFJ45698.1 hypothetical protein VOLCADRAFT_93830 [Volvox carteri f. nagariensis]|eukprot:XP_002953099.1 hypothetical protein VOLCADRAFT_93830 [Volvox carteri f. nagariensis]